MLSRMRLVVPIVILALSIGSLLACTQAQKAVGPEEFYRGKTITWVVSAGQAGGDETDLLARSIAPYLAKETGATIRVENVASDEGVNYVYGEAKRDGLTMVHKSMGAVVSNDILKAPGVLYESEKFNFVADVYPAGKVFQMSPKIPYKTLEDLRKAKGLKAGGTTAKGSLAISSAVMLQILGLDGKVITGFKAKKDMVLAVARGELDFFVSSDTGSQRDEDEGNAVNLLVATKERSILIPKVPTMYELGVKVEKDMEAALAFILAAGSAVALPPEVPAERVEYMRKAFQKLSDNKELQAEMEKLQGASRPFMPGKDLQQDIATVKTNTALADQLDAILAKYTAVQ